MTNDINASFRAKVKSVNWGAMHVAADQREGFAVDLQRNSRRVDHKPGFLSLLLGRL